MEKQYTYHATAHWTMHKRGIVEAEGNIPRTINFAETVHFRIISANTSA